MKISSTMQTVFNAVQQCHGQGLSPGFVCYSFHSLAKPVTALAVAVVLVMTWVFSPTSDERTLVVVATADLVWV